MDYRITTLKDEVVCDLIGIPDFPDIKFGAYGQYNLFNLTDYLRTLGREQSEDYRTISRLLRGFIEKLINAYGIPLDKLFFQNPNGDELVNGVLVYLFLIYLEDDFLRYANDLLDDIFVDGIAVSDSYVYKMARLRLAPEVLNNMLDEKRKLSRQAPDSSL